MARRWTAGELLEIVRGYQAACVVAAGAELDLFSVLSQRPMTAGELAARLQADPRAVAMLADALTALEVLAKHDETYSLAEGVEAALTERSAESVLAMVRHQVNCLRNWAQLAKVVRGGRRAERSPSIRGAQGDLQAFIEAMNDVSRGAAPNLVQAIGPPPFEHLLDVGGGPGTWTIEFLRAVPRGRATLFDLPEVLPIARRHIEAAGLADRVDLAGGNFETDAALPAGADLAWVSAIIHMNSPQENVSLFAKVLAALRPAGKVLLRDVVMEPSHVEPAEGALFAINMLVNTPGGGTYSFQEIREQLEVAGFAQVRWLHKGRAMDSVLEALKP